MSTHSSIEELTYESTHIPNTSRVSERVSERESNHLALQHYEALLHHCTLFVHRVSPHLQCSVCLDVLRKPVQCASGHSFCQRCITRVLVLRSEGQRVCPVCRVTLSATHLVVNRAVEGVIEDLVLRCPTTLDPDSNPDSNLDSNPDSNLCPLATPSDEDDGEVSAFLELEPSCEWTGPLHACRAHLLQCSHARVRCELPHCRREIKRRLLPTHIASCAISPECFFDLYCRTRCGSQEAWQQLKAMAHPLAEGYTALVLVMSNISSIPKNKSLARNLAGMTVPYLEKRAKKQLQQQHQSPLELISECDSLLWAHASFVLGSLWQEGVGCSSKRPKIVFELFEAAANAGHAGAQCSLGLCYDTGSGVPTNMHLAVKWYKMAAEQGYAAAQLNLGMCTFHGEGTLKDRGAALKYYESAAEQGHAKALFNLGVCLSSGEGGASCSEEAGVRLVRKAALQGFEPALKYMQKYRLPLYH
jgi:hypothetical protein